MFDSSFEGFFAEYTTTEDPHKVIEGLKLSEAMSNLCKTLKVMEVNKKALMAQRVFEFRLTQLIPPEKGGRGKKGMFANMGLSQNKLQHLRSDYKEIKDVEDCKSTFEKIWDKKGYVKLQKILIIKTMKAISILNIIPKLGL